jgi:hypothetical protein
MRNNRFLIMKTTLLLAFTWAILARGHSDHDEPFTLTYQTLVSQKVETATTTLSGMRPHGHHHHHSVPTSYSFNSAVNAYPTFSSITGPIASDAPAAGLPNATTLTGEAITLISKFKKSSPANCQLCQSIMAGVAARMKVQQETLSDIAITFCSTLQAILPMPICIGLLKTASTDIGGVFPAMDMLGEEGQTLCAFMFGTCDLPPPPKLDLNTLFKGKTEKPCPRAVSTCTCKREPLKVLHVSDYHLDMRYVAGSEANCTGTLCCRVYPYTNLSAPIQEPASIFGNYLCDTPEAVGRSLFQNVPKVTGHEWKDFLFGLFTGDLVSHDIWELTEPYVLAEELVSYQQFFDGMGGVKMYPTLGWAISI